VAERLRKEGKEEEYVGGRGSQDSLSSKGEYPACFSREKRKSELKTDRLGPLILIKR